MNCRHMETLSIQSFYQLSNGELNQTNEWISEIKLLIFSVLAKIFIVWLKLRISVTLCFYIFWYDDVFAKMVFPTRKY